jgi:hypothetical protein
MRGTIPPPPICLHGMVLSLKKSTWNIGCRENWIKEFYIKDMVK